MFVRQKIKEYISRKIEYIQASCDWISFDLCLTIEDLDISINLNNIEHQLDIWEGIAKLSIDLWRDFDYYGQFMFKGRYDSKEYKDGLEGLGYVYEEGMWRSTERPSKDVLETNVFIYFIYRLIHDEQICFDMCPFCDEYITFGERKCGSCGTFYKDILEQIKVTYQTKLKNSKKENKNIKNKKNIKIVGDEDYEDERWFCEECGKRNIRQKNLCEYCGTEEICLKNKNNPKKSLNDLDVNIDLGKNGGTKEEIVKEYLDKWKCGRCGCLNEYSYINCVACGGMYEEGKWMCGGCKEENLCINDKCGGCKNKNKNVRQNEKILIKESVLLKEKEMSVISLDKKEVKEKRGGINLDDGFHGKWKCGGCGYLSEYSFSNCVVCGGIYGDGKWMCGGCKEENICATEICGKCGSKNSNIKVKYGGICLERWKCGKCTFMNIIADEICEVCGSFNDRKVNEVPKNKVKYEECNEKIMIKKMSPFSLTRSESTRNYRRKDLGVNPVKNVLKAKEGKDEWKCGRCGLIQSFEFINCEACDGSMKENGSWKCGKCSETNVCKNIHCRKCGRKNDYLKFCASCKLNPVRMDHAQCDICIENKAPFEEQISFTIIPVKKRFDGDESN